MAPKPSTRPQNAGQPNAAEKKVQCGTCSIDSGFLLTNGHLVALFVSAVLLSPSQLLEHSLLANEQQWMLEPLQQEVSNQETRAPSKRSEPYAPNLLASKDRGDGSVDLWISLTKQMQQLQQQLVEAAVRHKHKAAEQEERAIEIGKSISQ